MVAEDLGRERNNPRPGDPRVRNYITETHVSGPMTLPATKPPQTYIPPPYPAYQTPGNGIPPSKLEKKAPIQLIILILIVIMALIYGIMIYSGMSRNGDDPEVQEEEAAVELVEANVYHMEQTDTITSSAFGPFGGETTSITYEFLVEDNATRATINTTHQGGNSHPDIDLYIYAPDGTEVASSAGATADEAVKLDDWDFERHGYGNYSAEIINYSNMSVTYEIVIEVYGMVPANQTGDGP